MTFIPKFVGEPIERSEDLRLLRGLGRYVDDIHRDGMLHAAFLRSSVAHGRIRSINTEAARAMPGVHAIFTAADVGRDSGGSIPNIPLRLGAPELLPFEQPVIAQEKVRYVGEPLAIVVADSRALAEDALEKIDVDIETLPPVSDRKTAMRDESLLFEERRSNCAITYTASKGDVSAVDAPYVRKEKFSVHRHSAVCLEPRGLLADWEGKSTRLTVIGAAKIPFTTRRVLAAQMDLPDESVEMVEVDVGGGFGVRGDFYCEDYLVPFAARRLHRPVKWIEDRLENLLSSNHARECDCEIEIACDREGRILSLRAESWVNGGAYMRAAATVQPRNLAQFLSGPYRILNVHAQTTVVLTNKMPTGVYRGPGRFEGDFFRERLFDMAANDLGIDRVEFRRRNLATVAEMPYRLPDITSPPKEEWLDSGDYGAALDRCLAEFNWDTKKSQQSKLINGRYHGLGVGCFVEGGGAGPRENARMVVEAEGYVSVFVGSANVGQGLETVAVQIAADALGVAMERIRFFHGSTTYLKEGFGSFHSRSVVMGGSAILDAAQNLKREISRVAAERLQCHVNEILFGPNLQVRRGDASLPLAEFAGLGAEGTFASHNHTYAYGTAAAHVAVDPGTGRVELLEYVTVEDVGRVINPLTATGQAIGAVVQGVGGTMLEHLQYDESAQLLTGSLADYLLPTSTDFPNIKAFVTGDWPSPHNPLGAKGGGEGGIVPVAGVLANAIANALAPLGVETRDLPFTPPKIWKLIQTAKIADLS